MPESSLTAPGLQLRVISVPQAAGTVQQLEFWFPKSVWEQEGAAHVPVGSRTAPAAQVVVVSVVHAAGSAQHTLLASPKS